MISKFPSPSKPLFWFSSLTIYTLIISAHYYSFFDDNDFGTYGKCKVKLPSSLQNITEWTSVMLNESQCLEVLADCPHRNLCSRPDSLAQAWLSGGVNYKGLLLYAPEGHITRFHSAATDTIACLIRGKKLWSFKNKYVSQYYSHEYLWNEVMFYSKYFLPHSGTSQVVQSPGECVYFKPWTLHHVKSYEESLLVTTHHCESIVDAVRQMFMKWKIR